jgi:hypothetical protein
MDEEFDPLEIFEADRPAVTTALQEPGSKARNERGALAVTRFKAIGRRVWSRNICAPDSHRSDVQSVPIPMPMQKSGRTYIERSEEMILVGYFLARCGSGEDHTEPPSVLETSHWEEVYPMFYNLLGGGRTLAAFRNSLQNTRDDFDFYVNNGREGWDKPLSRREQAVFDKWRARCCAELWAQVRLYLVPTHDTPQRSKQPALRLRKSN